LATSLIGKGGRGTTGKPIQCGGDESEAPSTMRRPKWRAHDLRRSANFFEIGRAKIKRILKGLSPEKEKKTKEKKVSVEPKKKDAAQQEVEISWRKGLA